MLSNNDKEALHDVDDRILMLERRLDNAKAARDAFVQHLRGKYPNWRPPLPTLSYQEANFAQLRRDPLLGRLSTSNYQWDVDENRRNPMRMPKLPDSRILDIPTSGPLLESDLRRSKIRLREISEELRSLRMDRMSLSTEQWMQNEQFRQHKSLRLALSTDSPRQIDHLDEARSRLATMEFTEHSPVETPTEERKMEVKFKEEHEKMVEEMRSGLIFERKIEEPSVPVQSVQNVQTLAQTGFVRFQEPTLEPALPPAVIPTAPPPQAPIVEQSIEKQAAQALLSNMFKFDDSDSDSEKVARPAPSAAQPAASSSTKPYDSTLLKNFITEQDSDSEQDNYFSGNRKPAKPAKSLMFQDFDDDDFFS